MSNFVIDLDKYDRVGKHHFRNRRTGKLYTPRKRNGRIELCRVIVEQPQIIEAEVQLLLPPPRYREEEKNEAPERKIETRRTGRVRTLASPLIIIIVGTFLILSIGTTAVVHHVIQQQQAASTQNASQALQRISQLDPNQYENNSQFETWKDSTCSAASITEAMNSYGGKYVIGQILDTELSLGVITPSLGLVGDAGASINTVANHYGFDTQAMSSLDQAIDTANNGTPVIVDIVPGSAWPYGHFVVMVGGDGSNLKIADSWSTNYQTLERSRFLSWGLGSMRSIFPSRYSLLQGHPTLSVDQINNVLSANNSPASGGGQDI